MQRYIKAYRIRPYLLNSPSPPSKPPPLNENIVVMAVEDEQQQHGQLKLNSVLGSFPTLVPELQGPEANALQYKIKNSIW